MKTMPTKEVIVKQNIGHDQMTITVKFPTGELIKWRVGRSGDRLELTLRKSIQDQSHVINDYVSQLKKGNGTYADQFNALEATCKDCQTTNELIDKIKGLL